ncbi:hypothetical protein [Bradyrhizobium sp. 142]|uniref:hypothetical protein n=1 Tax=Bradyrhizobium sp. 142 TaxID=2782618 RepID=UPI001FF8B410|nr:hypothetical protein [Bradyrhizobium sp. 142]
MEEEGTETAVDLRSRFQFGAPEVIIPECANTLWKKVQRSEVTRDEAVLAARLIERSGIDFLPMADARAGNEPCDRTLASGLCMTALI